MENKREIIGVLGAGVIGRGVAHRFSQYGYRTILLDNDEAVLDTAVRDIERNMKLAVMLGSKLDIPGEIERIKTTASYADLAEADFIIENVPEKIAVKATVYQTADRAVKNDCIFMANTSCIPITKIAAFTKRADKVIGVHFMNPVPQKDFTEVIKGYHTSEETIRRVKALLETIGITTEIINDSAGFVSNRLSHLFMNEAAYMIMEEVAAADQVDTIFKKGFKHSMGPLETADLIGLDTVLFSLDVLYEYYKDPKFRPCPLLTKMVDAGLLGRKSGQGFYNYK